jgi:hypothetical protein
MHRTLLAAFVFLAIFQASVPTTTWVQNQGYSAGTGITSGMVILLVSGSCQTGFTELSALNGMHSGKDAGELASICEG